MVILNVVEARVVGSLMEKEMTTPEYYPLSLNATMNACNQKSSREPVMELNEGDVRTALFSLEQMGLARTDASSRVSKFEHRMRDVLQLKRDETAVICLLLLRGPQTAAELRGRAERMHSFDDNGAVQSTLERLAARPEPLVVLLQGGGRGARWGHLLSGAVEGSVGAGVGGSEASYTRVAAYSHEAGPEVAAASPELLARVEALEELVREMDERLRMLEDCGLFGPPAA